MATQKEFHRLILDRLSHIQLIVQHAQDSLSANKACLLTDVQSELTRVKVEIQTLLYTSDLQTEKTHGEQLDMLSVPKSAGV